MFEALRRERQKPYTGPTDQTGPKKAERRRDWGRQADSVPVEKRVPDTIEEEDIGRRPRWSLRYDLMGLEVEATLPTISIPGWKARFNGNMAGLPADVAARLAFIEAEDTQTCRIRLRSGALLVARPERITLVHEGGDPDSRSAIAVMLELAKARGWPSIDVTGGTPRWRRRVVRTALTLGLPISTQELGVVVAEELNLLELVSLVRDLTDMRQSENGENDLVVLCAIAEHESLPRIWKRLDADLQDRIVAYGEGSFSLPPRGP